MNPDGLNTKQLLWIEKYLTCFNATKAARESGYKSPKQSGHENLNNPIVQKIIQERLDEFHMSADEALKLLSEIARGDIADVWDDNFNSIDAKKVKKNGKTKLIKSITRKNTTICTPKTTTELSTQKVEMYSAHDAIRDVLRLHGKFIDTVNVNTNKSLASERPFAIPADVIAPSFMDAYRDIVQQKHTEYIFSGGRGSTKSSFISLAIIYLIKNNPTVHALVMRQVANTLRDSVYAQLQWATEKLGVSDEFKATASPMEIEYLPTGQKIYFRGADDPGKIKSITPTFGYLGLVWFEELDQFHGQEAIRKIEQSIRGGDDTLYFKSFNPPPTKNNWANKYLLIPKATQYQHISTYLTVPPEWLGNTWLEEAGHLKQTNLAAYENEYLGMANNEGGMVFTNVRIEEITDEQIKEFDCVLHGLDWGFYPDPASYGRMHYDSARRTLYIFAEARYWKRSNEDLHKALISDHGYKDENLIIADSAEPKSVMDFKAYGANARGAEKGPESVKYSIKWLQGLNAIIIDNKRAPYHAEEFLNYEFERTKEGEIISEYPDKNNHAIDDVRYATNLIWRRRGE